MNFIDLHTHSRASDGTVAPGELPGLAGQAGLAAVALTDHDTVCGLDEFLEAGRRGAVECIPGVELAVRFGRREMHIIGLFIDHRDPALGEYLSDMRRRRLERNEAMRVKLNHLGYVVTYDHAAFAGKEPDSSIGRPNFAAAVRDLYGFGSSQEVFEKLLKPGRPAYVPRELPSPASALEAIHRAGGVSVWAHPVYCQSGEFAFARRVVKRLAPLGLDALECYYSMFGPGETQFLSDLAGQYGLARSGGSDFHGENSKVELGRGAGALRVPAELLDALRVKLEQVRNDRNLKM